MPEDIYVNRYNETPVGKGFYAMRTTVSKAGVSYTKLVQRDRSGPPRSAEALALRWRS